MEELVCYLPGNLALGVAEGAVAGEKALQYAAIAEELTLTCRRLYSLMPAGARPALQPMCTLVMKTEVSQRGAPPSAWQPLCLALNMSFETVLQHE